jgi:hypothetical protein
MRFLFVKQPLPKEEEQELKQTLQDLLGKGKIVKLEQKVHLFMQQLVLVDSNGSQKLKISIPS